MQCPGHCCGKTDWGRYYESILHSRKLTLREVKQLTVHHRVNKQWNQESNLGVADPQPKLPLKDLSLPSAPMFLQAALRGLPASAPCPLSSPLHKSKERRASATRQAPCRKLQKDASNWSDWSLDRSRLEDVSAPFQLWGAPPCCPSSAPLTRKDKHLHPLKPANSIIKHQQMLSLKREFHDHESHCPGDPPLQGNQGDHRLCLAPSCRHRAPPAQPSFRGRDPVIRRGHSEEQWAGPATMTTLGPSRTPQDSTASPTPCTTQLASPVQGHPQELGRLSAPWGYPTGGEVSGPRTGRESGSFQTAQLGGRASACLVTQDTLNATPGTHLWATRVTSRVGST